MFLGVDEAGRGPVLGPLVVGGLVSGDQEGLRKIGVRDSKELSSDRRGALHQHLVLTHYHCVLILPAPTIDRMRRRMTLNEIEVVCFSSVILSLLLNREFIHPSIEGDVDISLGGERIEIRRILMDAADVDESRFGESILEEVARFSDIGGIGILSKHKADRDHPVVGAASILAKVTRDRRIREISNEAGVDIGSGYPSDPITREFLMGYLRRKGSLPPFARSSWETCRKMVAEASQKTLLDF
ncbi:MAG: ribonuclease HII [Thermoplasmatota archaeon]